mmetsp:Transcript_41172/g.117122  ORF Transcript_41172/g.117122 Transcript_41172/m.117122 type:complete len:113 (-) Transcript_41172:206-544(-)
MTSRRLATGIGYKCPADGGGGSVNTCPFTRVCAVTGYGLNPAPLILCDPGYTGAKVKWTKGGDDKILMSPTYYDNDSSAGGDVVEYRDGRKYSGPKRCMWKLDKTPPCSWGK